MAILMPYHTYTCHPHKHLRRNATAVMAGAFDSPLKRDVLTSLLNGVPVYKAVERDEEGKRSRRKEKRERDRERKRQKRAEKRQALESFNPIMTPTTLTASTSSKPNPRLLPTTQWHARPAIHIPTLHRSVSVTPPPCTSPVHHLHSSLVSSSASSSTSRTSSKRPRTPADDEEIQIQDTPSLPPGPPSERRKRVAVKKGWKGWVEGSPPPSEKLINLDSVPVLQERKTRSGKHFSV